MKRPVRIVLWSGATVLAVGLSLWLLLIWNAFRGADSTVETRELSAGELSQSLRHLNPDIRVVAGFEAASYGGWHGDGGSLAIFHVEPSGTGELIAGLKRFHEEKRKEWPDDYDYEWSEASRPDLSSLEHLIPESFQPGPGVYVIGRARNGNHTISIGRENGYVCFASSRS